MCQASFDPSSSLKETNIKEEHRKENHRNTVALGYVYYRTAIRQLYFYWRGLPAKRICCDSGFGFDPSIARIFMSTQRKKRKIVAATNLSGHSFLLYLRWFYQRGSRVNEGYSMRGKVTEAVLYVSECERRNHACVSATAHYRIKERKKERKKGIHFLWGLNNPTKKAADNPI